MKKQFAFILFSISLFMISCGPRKADYEALKIENDSLRNIKTKLETEVNDYFSVMNQIQESIDEIKNVENIISMQSSGQEFDKDDHTRLKDDITHIINILKNNKQELDNLKSRLGNSSLKLGELENTITALTQSLDEETKKVLQLQALLAEKDSELQNLSSTMQMMEREIQDLTSINEERRKKLTEQEQSIYSAWYVFGTKKELKEQKILTQGGLFSKQEVLQSEDFNKDYFVRIDSRQVRTIELFSKRAKILTTHPESSYSLEKVDGQYVLNINDPARFWSISKYLVVNVD
jgi:chromosome segregation ATPase